MRLKRLILLSTILSLSIASPVFSFSLDFPFTSQAPYANWGQPWQDACEETVIAMIDRFYAQGGEFTKEEAKNSIQNIINIKEKYIGESLDENVDTIINLVNNYLSWEVKIAYNPTIYEIKKEIDNRRPVIMPVHGKYLYNKYFKNGGPDYHTIVISGYDDENEEFITQEPGTRWGLDFRYSYDIIENAMHDLVPEGQTKYGRRVAVFTRPDIYISADLDGDRDGLVKSEELLHKTSLIDKDSDNDGYDDGVETKMGYSPISTSKERKIIYIGTLIKAPNSPKVYLYNSGIKRHIANEQVFLNNGWRWYDIFPMSESFVSSLPEGEQIID
jgi:hypothetical protein